MSAAIFNMALVFGIVQLANKFELDSVQNAVYLRISYATVQAISLLIITWIYYKIKAKNDVTKLVYSEPKNPFQAEEPEPIVTTIMAYDIQQVKTLATQTLMGVAIISVMHYNWGYMRPLLLQSVLGLKTLAGAQIVQIWLFGRKAEGELCRPFKTPNPFGLDTPGPEVVTEKEIKNKEKKDEKKKIANKKVD